MAEGGSLIYHWYVTGFCFARVKPADKVLTPTANSALLAAALALGVQDGGMTGNGPRRLAEIREEAEALVKE